MDNLFLITFLLSVVAIVFFGVKAIVQYMKKDSVKGKKQLKMTGLATAAMVISFIGFGITMDPAETASDEQIKAATSIEEEEKQEEAKEAKEKAEREVEEAKATEEKATKEKEEAKAKAEKEAKALTSAAENKKTNTPAVNEGELKNYASNITGRTFVKSIALMDNYSVINFYNNFKEYKNENPDSLLTEVDYKEYFSTGQAIEKILVIENIRLLRQFPGLAGAKMTLPFEGKTYSINIDRASINDYLGFKVEELKTEDDSWVTKFVNPVAYNEQKRKYIMEKFGTVK